MTQRESGLFDQASYKVGHYEDETTATFSEKLCIKDLIDHSQTIWLDQSAQKKYTNKQFERIR